MVLLALLAAAVGAPAALADAPGLAITKTGPEGLVQMGDRLTYTIVVTNTGDASLTNVVIGDELLGLDEDVGTLDPGASATVVGTLWVTDALVPIDLPPGARSFAVTNTATATSDQAGPVSARWDVEVEYSFHAWRAAVGLEKVGPAVARVGDTIEYHLRVTNIGDVPLSDVRVSDPKLGLSEAVGALRPGEERTYVARYTLTDADLPGPVRNVATATSAESDPAVATWDVAIAPSRPLTLAKTGPTGPVDVGETILYTLRVRNAGDAPLGDVRVSDARLGFEETIPTLAPGEAREFTLAYTVTEADLGGDAVLRNVATASSPAVGTVTGAWSVPIAGGPGEPGEPGPETGGCERSDLAVVVYGGWDGIPVRAWVGDAEQPAKRTSLNARGEAQATWTLYPPAGTLWTVRVAAELPADLDASRWEIVPVGPTTVSLGRCEERAVYMQLVDHGEPATGGPASMPVAPQLPQAGAVSADVAARPVGWLAVGALTGLLARREARRRRR